MDFLRGRIGGKEPREKNKKLKIMAERGRCERDI
jgi:hypothetical protein